MPQATLFFKAKKDKNGNTYYDARTRSGKIKCQLFPTTKSSEFDYTMTMSYPRRKRMYRKRRYTSSANSNMNWFMKGMQAAK